MTTLHVLLQGKIAQWTRILQVINYEIAKFYFTHLFLVLFAVNIKCITKVLLRKKTLRTTPFFIIGKGANYA